MSDVRVCVVLLLSFCASAAPPLGAAPAEGDLLHNPLCNLKGCSIQIALTWGGIGDPTVTHSRAGALEKGASDLVKNSSSVSTDVLRIASFFAEPDPLPRPTKVPDESNASMPIPTYASVRCLCALCVGSRPAEKSGNEEKNVEKNIVSYYFLSDFCVGVAFLTPPRVPKGMA